MKYIQKIDERPLYGDGIGKVSLYDLSRCNTNQESRIECVTKIAGVCYGQDEIKNPEKLYKKLWDENASTLEFVRNGLGGWGSSIDASLRNMTKLLLTNEQIMREKENWNLNSMEGLLREHKANIATFLIKVPIFIARQVMRHRQFSYQELSRRYTTDKRVPLEFWMPPLEEIKAEEELEADIIWLRNYFQHSLEVYDMLVGDGLPAERARAVLPLSLYTQFWMMGGAPAWKNYFNLRTEPGAQKEHRALAEAMLDLLREHQPKLWKKVRP